MADLIAQLFPGYDSEHSASYVEQIIEDARGTPRFVEARDNSQRENIRSRETTVGPEDDQDDDKMEEEEHDPLDRQDSIALAFSDRTYKNRKGIMFGCNSDACDIVLPRLDKISREHCYLTFDHKRRLIVEDRSTNGTMVLYNERGKIKRKRFRWIIGGDSFLTAQDIIIQIHGQVKFRIVVPEHDTSSDEYQSSVDDFLAHLSELPAVPVGQLGMQDDRKTLDNSGFVSGAASSPSSPVGHLTPVPTKSSILLDGQVLGEGKYGCVTHVWDASTGADYASKVFLNAHRSIWKAEIGRMKSLSHPNIVQLKTFFGGPQPKIIMEYAAFGDLRTQKAREPFSSSQLREILTQSLSALKYLHGLKPQLVHRDIKPDNILVHSRDPIHVKLADFGISKHGDDLRSVCGTSIYLAPEIFALRENRENGSYSAAVDIWSLGVTIFECGGKLPRRRAEHHGHEWCEQLVEALHGWKLDELDVIHCMLVINPVERLSAVECLQFIQGHQTSSTSIESRQSDGSKSGTGTVAAKRARPSNPDPPASLSDGNRPARRKRKGKGKDKASS